MFKKYGTLGIILIVLVELNFFFQIQPFADWYFPIIWYGYILTIDALVYKLRGNSLISNRFAQFLGMIVLSALFWWVFELMNLPIQNWEYVGTERFGIYAVFFETLAFSTVLPALFETIELLKAFHLFDKEEFHKKHKIAKQLLHAMIVAGVLCLVLPWIIPTYAFPLVWLGFFLLLDPMNYIHKQPSILGHIKEGRWQIIFTLLIAGIVLGFLWEFWNYWAISKWTYNIPFVGFLKLFEMPILGYLGYFPFALELYAMYWYVRSLFLQKEAEVE